ncbi:type II toxin-antitoxin system VapC family toxin [Gellertiella hungarica]|uniref:Putative nucleic-acid-binding protein n=1 Tax=Gellertiella hungarica TaxID=1572859 RepID=A0A7W6J7R6_9HYPH|nr:type II toxin-antitoxin system VapC family toxin [Gellertiella hungarica]MBB4066364.1 putative nucleic-acid-binding protein [Gellertiella hungarica]
MQAVDTNVVVRYLTADHPQQAARARAIIGEHKVFLSLTVILECEWVLRTAYRFEQRDVIDALRAFCGLPGVRLDQPEVVSTALMLAEQKVDFADAIHIAQAGTNAFSFVTFDRKLARAAQKAGHHYVREA